MSRVGRQPIPIPEKVKVAVQGNLCLVEGPGGKLTRSFDPGLEVVVGKAIEVKRHGESREIRSLHGLTRNLIRNMVEGVSHGFKKELEISGVGYRAEVKGKDLSMTLGFSHPVLFPIPDGIKIHVDKQVRLEISGASRELVGETAARIRKLRLPEPYKGKGIKYAGEVIQRKVGKAAVAAGGGK